MSKYTDKSGHTVHLPDQSYFRTTFQGKKSGERVDEAFKVTAEGANCFVNECTIGGGSEDCLDAVMVENLTVVKSILDTENVSRTHITIKGGSDMFIKDTVLKGKTKFPWQISAGDYTLYNRRKDLRQTVVSVGLNVRREGGKKPWILILDAKVIDPHNQLRKIKVHKLIVSLLFAFQRKFGDKRDWKMTPYREKFFNRSN